MANKNNEYPKEIITIEKVTENSENSKKVITTVSNEFEEHAVNVAIKFMKAFNERDAAKCNELLNYPHARLGKRNDNLIITKNPPQIRSGFFQTFINNYKWNHSCWDYRKVIQSDSAKVHLAIQFSRYMSNGTKIGVFPSFWVITNQNGHWGIKMRSSYAP